MWAYVYETLCILGMRRGFTLRNYIWEHGIRVSEILVMCMESNLLIAWYECNLKGTRVTLLYLGGGDRLEALIPKLSGTELYVPRFLTLPIETKIIVILSKKRKYITHQRLKLTYPFPSFNFSSSLQNFQLKHLTSKKKK